MAVGRIPGVARRTARHPERLSSIRNRSTLKERHMISNGVLNLASDKRQAFGEALRILEPGGQFLYAEIIVASELSESIGRHIDLWTV
jgi:hypothetical protein